MLDFPTRQENLQWALARSSQTASGDIDIISVIDGEASELLGIFDGKTGNAYLVGANREEPPAVLNVGDVQEDETGQLKALQEQGNYLRVCRWDRMSSSKSGISFRTLPQCGCGGYLGTPKFFETFAEMSAYVFCMFCL